MALGEASNTRLLFLLHLCSRRELAELSHVLTGDSDVLSPEELVDLVRRCGSNTLATYLFRGGAGVDYQEVVYDVASRLGVDASREQDERDLEVQILAKVIDLYLRNASPEEREAVEEILQQAAQDASLVAAKLATQGTGALLTVLANTLGRKAVERVIRNILKKILARAAARQAAKYAVPGLNVIFIGLLVLDVAGPAYRKTIQAVIQIALLRLSYANDAKPGRRAA